MPDLFALQGISSVGKTQTLVALYNALKAKYPGAQEKFLHRRVELTVILRGVNGHCIGIESQGDPNSRLAASLQAFSGICDIIFCACRTSGNTVDAVNALAPAYRITFVPKTRASGDHAAANAAAAASLMRLAGL